MTAYMHDSVHLSSVYTDYSFSDYDMMMMTTITMLYVFFRCFSDVKTAVRISIASGLTTKLDLGTSLANSGLVCPQNIFLKISFD